MGFKYAKWIRMFIEPFLRGPVPFDAAAIDLAGATSRIVHSAVHVRDGASTANMRARARFIARWLDRAMCIGPATKAIEISSLEDPPKIKAAEQEKRKKAHAEVSMPPAIVAETALAGTERAEMLHFVRNSRVSVDLSVAQARALVHAARPAFSDICAETLLGLRAQGVDVGEANHLDEGEASAVEWAIRYLEANPGASAVVVSSDTDVYGIALAKWARVRPLAGRLFFYDCGLSPPADTPLNTPGRCFADLGALAASIADAHSARARLMQWIAWGTDYTPKLIGDVLQDHEDVFMMWFDAADDERDSYFDERVRKSKLPIDGPTYVDMARWMHDYYAAAERADIPSPLGRGWHAPEGGVWRPGRGAANPAGAPALRLKRRRAESGAECPTGTS